MSSNPVLPQIEQGVHATHDNLPLIDVLQEYYHILYLEDALHETSNSMETESLLNALAGYTKGGLRLDEDYSDGTGFLIQEAAIASAVYKTQTDKGAPAGGIIIRVVEAQFDCQASMADKGGMIRSVKRLMWMSQSKNEDYAQVAKTSLRNKKRFLAHVLGTDNLEDYLLGKVKL